MNEQIPLSAPMAEAVRLSRLAAAAGEVPVGAVVTDKNGEIIGRGFNTVETEKTALGHAELAAIDEACRNLGGRRLHGCTLFVTLEPCPMCAGAVIMSGMKKVVFIAANQKFGSCGGGDFTGENSIVNLLHLPYPIAKVETEIEYDNDYMRLLSDFFVNLRKKNSMYTVKFIEAATMAQIKRVVVMAREIWTEKYYPLIGEAQTDYMIENFQTAEKIQQQIESDGYTYFIIVKNNEDVGYIAIKNDGERLFLSKAYIYKQFRGNGYFKQAVEYIKDIAKSRNLKSIWLTVNKRNDSAEIYKRLNFKKSGEGIADIGAGFFMDDDYYELNVTN
jgi:tRNA(Arg) A34 adenosine deaminase TadA/GNAT superfamily N-acetyltransferase